MDFPVRPIFPFIAALICAGAWGCREHVERTEWTAMGTVAALQTRPASPRHALLSETARTACAETERALNAHAPASEIRRLAPLADDEVLRRCSPETRPCYAAAFALARDSGGAFDPRWRGPGTLDLGAIAKGFAVDRAAARLSPDGAALLDLGGNLKAVGPADGRASRGWRTGVRAPGGGVCATVTLTDGEALATSAEYYRGRHIRDGRTGRPAASGVASVTVLCRSAMLADGLSTALFVLGPEEGLAFLKRRGDDVSVFFLMKDGRRVVNDARFTPVGP